MQAGRVDLTTIRGGVCLSWGQIAESHACVWGVFWVPVAVSTVAGIVPQLALRAAKQGKRIPGSDASSSPGHRTRLQELTEGRHPKGWELAIGNKQEAGYILDSKRRAKEVNLLSQPCMCLWRVLGAGGGC